MVVSVLTAVASLVAERRLERAGFSPCFSPGWGPVLGGGGAWT